MKAKPVRFALRLFVAAAPFLLADSSSQAGPAELPLNDGHVHLTNYIQEGITAQRLLELMGNRVNRAVLFGIPLQQQWSYRVSEKTAPTYYLETDAPLYYYSFTDAYIAMAYRSLSKAQQARFDPMITGFNPTDMYAADHIRRVLQTFPGVFSGIGEFTIHKEFVSSKIAGEVASLTDPALDRLLDFAAEVGLVALVHNDIDTPFPKAGAEPTYFAQMKALLRRHPGTTIIWAHVGVGRIIHPVKNHAAAVESILSDPTLSHVHFDISWNETAKYLVSSPETIKIAAAVMDKYPDRFLFGTDEVAPKDQKSYLDIADRYAPLFHALSPQTSEKLRRGNYARIFDQARAKVRAWEAAHAK
ncbi:MAG: amidohydrolase family protein [Polyangiales bacterium]